MTNKLMDAMYSVLVPFKNDSKLRLSLFDHLARMSIKNALTDLRWTGFR